VTTDLSELATRVPRPNDDTRAAARARLTELAPAGAFGRLGELAEWIAGVQGQCPTRPLDQVRFIAVAASPSGPPAATPGAAASPTITARPRLSAILPFSPATPRLVEVFRRIKAGEYDRNPPHDAEGAPPSDASAVEQAFEVGLTVADEEADGGADLLVLVEIDGESVIAAATTVAVLSGTDVASVVGSTGIDDREWMRRCAAVRDTARYARRTLADGADILGLLSTVGSVELATCTGVLAQAAIRETPVVLDGMGTAAAALVAHRLNPRTTRWLLAGHESPDPGHATALSKLRLRPLIDYAISVDDGTGALLAVTHLQAAARLLAADGSG
jgi:nicotinate-nucleotide--dimethylbenzimidazole phosphoribosyltransferase